MALRTAIGASRSRLVRQLMTESLAIGVIGGAWGGSLSVYFGRSCSRFCRQVPKSRSSRQYADLRVSASSRSGAESFRRGAVLQVAGDHAATALKSGRATAHSRTAVGIPRRADVV